MTIKFDIHSYIKIYKLIYKCDRKSFVSLALLTFLNSVLPLVNLYILKILVDSVSEGLTSLETVIGPAIAFTIVYTMAHVITSLCQCNRDILGQRMTDFISDIVHRKSEQLSMSFYDNSEYHDTLYRAQMESSLRPIYIMVESADLFGSVISIVGILGMLATSSPLTIVVMIVSIIPSFFVRIIRARRLFKYNQERTPLIRKASYLSSLLTSKAYTLEVKGRGLTDTFRSRFLETRAQVREKIIQIIRRMTMYDLLCTLLEAVALLFVIILLVRGTIGGAYTVGSFVMLFEAFRRGQQQLQSMTRSITNLYDSGLFVSNLFEFLDLEPDITDSPDTLPFPDHIDTVSFDNITFSYPNSSRSVFVNYSLTAKCGEITKIEGSNGFGKTTLVKLLFRMYDPSEGSVRINGIDIRRFKIKDLRTNLSAAFQQITTYCFSVRENIEFGDIEHPGDQERFRRAVEISGIDEFVSKYPDGYDTMLGREFYNGEEPSMGQRQRLEIARQMYSDAPVLVFDEPTSWMDARSRDAFKDHLEEIKKDKVIFLISHIQ